jgi:hypothetical protein
LRQDYGGISSSRLEVLEERLKDDVIAEIRAFGGRVLLHNETSEGGVVPIWEDALENDVAVLREVFDSKKDANGVGCITPECRLRLKHRLILRSECSSLWDLVWEHGLIGK